MKDQGTGVQGVTVPGDWKELETQGGLVDR